MCMSGLPVCLYIAFMLNTLRFPNIGVTGGHKPPCGYYKSYLGSLEKQPVLLSDDLSIQLLSFCLMRITILIIFKCIQNM